MFLVKFQVSTLGESHLCSQNFLVKALVEISML